MAEPAQVPKRRLPMKPARIKSSPERCAVYAPFLLAAMFVSLHTALAEPSMQHAWVEPDIELEYTIHGCGEPVVLLHAGLFADWFRPLLEEPVLTTRYRMLSFHRTGYAGSSRVQGSVDLQRQAAQVRALMTQLGIGPAHIVGHSSGGNIALQLALDAPDLVHSLALLEPALPVGTGSERLLTTRHDAMRSIMEQFHSGNRAGAVDSFMRMVSGPTYRASFDRKLPGAFAQGVVDSDTFFAQELPAVQRWQFTREDAARITQPALAIVGERSLAMSPIWQERHRLLLAWLPNAEGLVLSDTSHLMQVQNPRGVADALASFFARHSMRRPHC
jgi:pimeloyl-ACP methyl ester carboxylesterase